MILVNEPKKILNKIKQKYTDNNTDVMGHSLVQKPLKHSETFHKLKIYLLLINLLHPKI